MAALAALLLFVAWNMAELPHFRRILRTAPRSDVAVLLLCFSLTVVFDMVVSVTVGILLSAILFMRRMAEVSGVRFVGSTRRDLREPLPPGVVLYEINGPLFFGAAQKAMSALETVEHDVKVVILDMAAVPAIDATGLVALESAIARLNEDGVKVILAGVGGQTLRALARAGWRNRKGRLRIFASFERAVERAREHVLAAAGDR
jgi:SulP family sulfate permease